MLLQFFAAGILLIKLFTAQSEASCPIVSNYNELQKIFGNVRPDGSESQLVLTLMPQEALAKLRLELVAMKETIARDSTYEEKRARSYKEIPAAPGLLQRLGPASLPAYFTNGTPGTASYTRAVDEGERGDGYIVRDEFYIVYAMPSERDIADLIFRVTETERRLIGLKRDRPTEYEALTGLLSQDAVGEYQKAIVQLGLAKKSEAAELRRKGGDLTAKEALKIIDADGLSEIYEKVMALRPHQKAEFFSILSRAVAVELAGGKLENLTLATIEAELKLVSERIKAAPPKQTNRRWESVEIWQWVDDDVPETEDEILQTSLFRLKERIEWMNDNPGKYFALRSAMGSVSPKDLFVISKAMDVQPKKK